MTVWKHARLWRRPRALVLAALVVVAAWMIARQGAQQAKEGVAPVTAWVQEAARRASVPGGDAPSLGSTDPFVADAFVAWAAAALPAGVVADPVVLVEPIAKGSAERAPSATHRATIELRGSRATLFIAWDGTTATAVAFERAAPAESPPAPAHSN